MDANKDGLYVNGIVNGTLVRFLVDTGANITIIQTHLWEAMSRSPVSTPSKLEHVLDTMKLADGRSSSFLGQGKMMIGLGDLQLPCIRLACGKFELTNQDSAVGKKFSVLTSM